MQQRDVQRMKELLCVLVLLCRLRLAAAAVTTTNIEHYMSCSSSCTNCLAALIAICKSCFVRLLSLTLHASSQDTPASACNPNPDQQPAIKHLLHHLSSHH